VRTSRQEAARASRSHPERECVRYSLPAQQAASVGLPPPFFGAILIFFMFLSDSSSTHRECAQQLAFTAAASVSLTTCFSEKLFFLSHLERENMRHSLPAQPQPQLV
jgi:hypothetical protein